MADVGATTTTLKIPSDDLVLPFRTVRSGVIGRLVRLGPAVDEILSHHAAPNAVSQTLGEAVALTALLGTALKIDGKLTLQTKTDGMLDFLVVSYEPPGRLRAYARYDKKRVGADDDIARGELIGSGHLAITIDPGEEMERYQGIVALTGEGLGEAALTYFHQSEQLPSFVRLAVARHYTAGEKGAPGRWQWRAGGLMIQHLARPAARSRCWMKRLVTTSTTARRTTIGSARASSPRRSKITSCSIRRSRLTGFSTGCFTRKACAPSPPLRSKPTAAVRASGWKGSCALSAPRN